jgi:hypothetical protein
MSAKTDRTEKKESALADGGQRESEPVPFLNKPQLEFGLFW